MKKEKTMAVVLDETGEASGDFLSSISDLRNDQENADYTLECEGKTLRVHLFILKLRSPYFKAGISTPMIEKEEMKMVIKKCTFEVLEQAINFIYGVDIAEDFSNLTELLEIAESFKMEGLKHAVGIRLGKKINTSNFIEFSQMAGMYNVDVLAKNCAKYFLHQEKNDVKWDEIKSLPSLVNAHIAFMAKKSATRQGFMEN